MAISDKTRKLLWGRAQMRCSYCRNKLDLDATSKDDESIIGEECHIISARSNGPRYQPNFSKNKIDSYENLILLCRIHHKMIDDQHETYTAEILFNIKTNHEKWVAEKLESTDNQPKPVRIRRIKKNIPEYLKRITTGQELLNIIDRIDACYLGHDELNDEKETDRVGTFLQMVQDWGDFSSDFDVSYRVSAAFELSQSLIELEESGFFVFGAREDQIIEGGIEQPTKFPVAHIRVIHQTSEEILTGEKLFKHIVNTYKDQL